MVNLFELLPKFFFSNLVTAKTMLTPKNQDKLITASLQQKDK